jgi:pectinesterase
MPGKIRVVVAANGSGDFTTVQQAIDHAPVEGAGRLIIEIRPGVYHERVIIPEDRPRVTLIGLGTNPADTVITYSMSAKAAGGTFFSSTVEINGTAFHAENLTFENSYGPGSQAVALAIHSDRAVFLHCRFIGYQDTLYAAAGRQYYYRCSIEGAVDFIFGNARAVFDHCAIQSVGPGYITAQSRREPAGAGGYVFYRCRLTGENTGKGVFLGRPWRSYSRVVYIDCWMGNHIRPSGWNNWNSVAKEKTAWYAEVGSSGPGANPTARVKWARRLSPGEARHFLPRNFLRGKDHWNPAGAGVE